jgi:hypothetical protein
MDTTLQLPTALQEAASTFGQAIRAAGYVSAYLEALRR